MNIHLPRATRLALRTTALLLGPALAHPSSLSATTYTWTNTVDGIWSSSSNWNPSGGPPGSGDIANIFNPAAVIGSISYDVSASGTLASFNLNNTSGAAIQTVLDLNRSLTLTGGTSTLFTTVSGATVRLRLNGNSSLTIDSGAVLEIGTNSTSEQAYYTAIMTGTGYTGTGVLVNGELKLINGVSGSAGFTVQGPVTIGSGGILTAQGNNAVENPVFTGNFTTTGTNTIRVTTTGTSTTTSAKFTFQGAVNSFSAGTTFTGIGNATTSNYINNPTGLIFNPTAATPNQSLTMGVVQDFAVLHSTASLNAVETFTSTATNNGVGSVLLNVTAGGTTGSPSKLTFKLGSNLTYAGNSGQSQFSFLFNSQSNITHAIDLNGFSYDSGAFKSFTPFPSGAGPGAGTNFVQFVNSGSSSLAGGNGVFKAAKFGFTQTNLEVGVGAGVILQATRADQLNDLGHGTSGQSIDAASSFYYTGAGTSALKSDRSIGALIVGTSDGSGSTLALSSNLTAAGLATVNTGSTLNLTNATGTAVGTAGTYTLATTGLSGSGALTNNAAGATATTVTINGGGSDTFSGVISDNSGTNTLSLVYSGTGTQILSGANTYRGTTSVSSGTLLINGSQASATGAVNVTGTGTLGGSGTTGGAVTLATGATLAAGNNGVGNLTVASLTMNAGSTANFEVNGSTGGQYDTVTASGGFSFNGTLNLDISTTLADNSSLDLFLGSATSGNFASVTLTGLGYGSDSFDNGGSGTLWTSIQGAQTLTFDATTGILAVTGSAVPEPATAALLTAVAGLLFAAGRRRRNL
jgi:hypothetical protein